MSLSSSSSSRSTVGDFGRAKGSDPRHRIPPFLPLQLAKENQSPDQTLQSLLPVIYDKNTKSITQDSRHIKTSSLPRNWHHAQRRDMNASCPPFPLPQPPQPPPQPCKWGKSRNILCLIRRPPNPRLRLRNTQKRVIQIFRLTHTQSNSKSCCIATLTYSLHTITTLLLRQSEAHHAVATIAAIATVATIVTVAAEVTVAATEITIATAFMSNVKSQSRFRDKWIFRSENQNVQAGKSLQRVL